MKHHLFVMFRCGLGHPVPFTDLVLLRMVVLLTNNLLWDMGGREGVADFCVQCMCVCVLACVYVCVCMWVTVFLLLEDWCMCACACSQVTISAVGIFVLSPKSDTEISSLPQPLPICSSSVNQHFSVCGERRRWVGVELIFLYTVCVCVCVRACVHVCVCMHLYLWLLEDQRWSQYLALKPCSPPPPTPALRSHSAACTWGSWYVWCWSS